MPNIFLESERLFLKPLSIDDLLYIKNNKADAVKTPILPQLLSDDAISAITKKIEKMKKVNAELHNWYTYWLIIDREYGKGIGFIGFKGINENGYTEVGYSISPDYRKRRLMTEALKTFINWAYEYQNLKGITANVRKTNIGSVKVLQNCNFELAGSSELEDFYCLRLR